MGMTDLQFKSYLKLLIRALEAVESKDTKEAILAEIAKLKKDLEDDLKGCGSPPQEFRRRSGEIN